MPTNICLGFRMTHPSFDCVIQNARMTHAEWVLIHPTNPVCVVLCILYVQYKIERKGWERKWHVTNCCIKAIFKLLKRNGWQCSPVHETGSLHSEPDHGDRQPSISTWLIDNRKDIIIVTAYSYRQLCSADFRTATHLWCAMSWVVVISAVASASWHIAHGEAAVRHHLCSW